MKQMILISAICFAFVSCAQNAANQDTQAGVAQVTVSETSSKEPLGREESILLEVSANVEAVDVKKRKLTVKGKDGRSQTIKVSPNVKRLAEINVGDEILLSYYESVAFEVREPTEAEKENPSMLMEAAGKAGSDAPPAAGALVKAHAILTIQAIDKTEETVTLKGPEGNSFTVKARYPENLERIKVGDTVAVTYTEALAIGVQPLKKQG